ncbi:MAG: hypothetical protein LC800_18045 [Acidobacteria bacterium]|nr:hypothetical protein [Acidobacteriota bacterium]
MFPTRALRHAALALVVASAAASAAHARQTAKLGRVDFPTSTKSREAQEHFLLGVAALHSFWYEEALDEFRAAAKSDPAFALAYWGEAMAHNHPLWAEQDAEAARRVLENIKDTSKLTPRERGFVAAVRTLYAEGDKLARDRAYAAAMEKLHREHPDDLEAASFYSLALLGTWRQGDRGFASQMKAGAVALAVYERNPEHPGAAHYIIHAFDDPEHAVLALPAARRYAEIAPAAHHARHMPSHIFLQLGMWPEAAASNESGWQVSVEAAERKRRPMGSRDYHSLHWLTYVYLQQGRVAEAEKLLAAKQRDMAASNYHPAVNRAFVDMAGAYFSETNRWDKAAAFVETFDKAYKSAASTYGGTAVKETCHAAESGGGAGGPAKPAPPAAKTAAPTRDEAVGRMSPLYFRGLVAAHNKDAATAGRIVAELRALREAFAGRPLSKRIGVYEFSVAAVLAASQNRVDEAVALMREATKFEEELSPPSGPPDFFKPSHELFGEILLQAGRPAEAAAQFAVALQRQPGRARSLLGAARAAAAGKDDAKAVASYTSLLRQWQRADATLPELREARSFVEQAKKD